MLQTSIEELIDALVPLTTVASVVERSTPILVGVPGVELVTLSVIDDEGFTLHRMHRDRSFAPVRIDDVERDPMFFRLREGQTQVIDIDNPDPCPDGCDPAEWALAYERCLRRGLHRVLFVPTISSGQTLGALWFSSSQHDAFDDPSVQALIEVLANVVSMALAKAEALTRVADRVRAVDATHDELEAVNRDLQDFAQMASSGLGDPLRKLMSYSDRLESSAVDELTDRELDYLARIHSASDRMRRLIDDLLLFSSVHTPAATPERVDLDVVLDGVLADLEIAIAESAATIEREPLPFVMGNETQLRQLLQNLIGNAIKFRSGDVAPVISIRAIAADPVCVEVVDNGIGFDPRFLDRIFKPFQRLHGRDEFEGSGIGLSVCRRIAERHGGELTAASVPGEGSTFLVTLGAVG